MEDEETWCSDVTSCSCAMLRFAKDPRTEAGLKEFIVRRRGAAGGAGTIKVNAVSDLSGGDSIQM